MIRSFRGLTVLVTGASSGIGKEMARILAHEGANLILVARNLSRLEQGACDLRRRHGVSVQVFAGDLSQKETCQKLFDFTKQQGKTVDILINNAGFGYHGFFEGMESRAAEAMLAVNVESLVLLTRLFLPGMLERRKGGILNVASTAGFQAIPRLSLYAATKAFVISFSEALWSECKDRGVRIFCLCPGNTLTQFHQTARILRSQMFFSSSAHKVARFALKKFLKSRRPTGIYGFWNKLMIYAERLAPRQVTVFITNLMYRAEAAKTG